MAVQHKQANDNKLIDKRVNYHIQYLESTGNKVIGQAEHVNQNRLDQLHKQKVKFAVLSRAETLVPANIENL